METTMTVQREAGNGASVIVQKSPGVVLVVQENYKEKLWVLPGGKVDRGESPRHAGQEEVEEESGVIIYEKDMRLVGFFNQKPSGVVFLYETTKYEGSLRTEADDEILTARFMSLQEIIDQREQFRTASIRMILHHQRSIHGLDTIPIEGRLGDRVEYPKGLGIEFDGILLQI